MKQLIVATNSPRRRDLMKQSGFQFTTFSKDIDEEIPPGISVYEAALYLAKVKNSAYRTYFKDEVILTADTTVICHNELLEKPTSAEHAFEMLSKLSGNVSEVVSGVCITSDKHTASFDACTKVYFNTLSSEEITTYIKHFQPFDKAGAYGIQEWIGLIGIASIQGSYYNVMGLPIDLVYQTLVREFDIIPDLESE